MTASVPVIEARVLRKTFRMGSVDVHALRGVSFTIAAGEMVAIMGQSGSGKSTLMNLLGCLDTPTQGDYFLSGTSVASLNDDALAAIRNRRIGFVFQSFNLLPRLSAAEQVMEPLVYAHRRDRRKAAVRALEIVGLSDRVHHRPSELSGGQQQRVAVARALVTEPDLILADEPTGNLDSSTADDIMALLQRLNSERGVTVVLVTHEHDIAAYTQRTIRMRDGLIEADGPSAAPADAASRRPNPSLA